MKIIAKITLGASSFGAVTVLGLGVSHYYSNGTIKDYIERHKKSKNKIFLTSNTPKLNEIKEKYKTSNRSKPKKDGGFIKDTKLAEWCESSVNGRFIDENDDIYKGIISWCYINTNDFKTQLSSENKDILSTESETHQVWKNAWKNYKKDITKENLKITDPTYDALNKDIEEEAGKAMHKWCKAIYDENKKLYEDNSEQDYERFIRWCSKNKS